MKTLLLLAAMILPSVSCASDFADVSPLLQKLIAQARQVRRPDSKAGAHLVATDSNCTTSGKCCGMWLAGAGCANEYPCAECMNLPNGVTGYDTTACHPSGRCCAQRAAGGVCLAPYACPRC